VTRTTSRNNTLAYVLVSHQKLKHMKADKQYFWLQLETLTNIYD